MEGWVGLGYPAMLRPRVELATSRSQVRRPNHYTTEPPVKPVYPVDCDGCVPGTAAGIPTWTRSVRSSTRRPRRRRISSISTTGWATCSARWRRCEEEAEETVLSTWRRSPVWRKRSRNSACSTRPRSANKGPLYRMDHKYNETCNRTQNLKLLQLQQAAAIKHKTSNSCASFAWPVLCFIADICCSCNNNFKF